MQRPIIFFAITGIIKEKRNEIKKNMGGTWSSVGPSGPPGSPGVSGAQGAQGASGARGMDKAGGQGGQGVSGPSGLQGNQGAQGEQGPSGGQGASGATGDQGILNTVDPVTLNSSVTLTNGGASFEKDLNVSSGTLLAQLSYSLPAGYTVAEVTKNYTSAELKAFGAQNTPLVVVAAQGAKTTMRPLYTYVLYNLVTTGYTVAANDTFAVYFQGSPTIGSSTNIIWHTWTSVSAGSQGGVNSSTSSQLWFPQLQSAFNAGFGLSGVTSNRNWVNVPLMFTHSTGSLNTAGAPSVDWTGGDGTITLYMQYAVIDGLP